MGLSMTVAFLILRVPFGLLFGLGVGVMTIIPFGAPFSICIVSLLITLNNFWLGVTVLAVATVIEQVIESGVAPRLLGGFIGLNPVWILVSLLVGVKVAGVAGLIVAVPMAGFIKNTVDVLEISRNKSREIDSVSSIEPIGSIKLPPEVQILDLNGVLAVYFDLALGLGVALVATLALGLGAALVATLALALGVALAAVLVAGFVVAACAAGIPAVPAMPDNNAPRARAVARKDLPNLKFMVDDFC